MVTLARPTAPTTEAYLQAAGPRLADLCTACGACFDACPIVDYINLRGADAQAITMDVRKLARNEAAGELAVSWLAACTKSGKCRSACPEQSAGLDAMLLIRIAKQHAINVTHQIKPKADPTAFPRVKTFARLQLTDEELAKWL
jgi:ferredoxin